MYKNKPKIQGWAEGWRKTFQETNGPKLEKQASHIYRRQ